MANNKNTQRCENCDWTETTDTFHWQLNPLLPDGTRGVVCSLLHKTKKKDGGKYCKNFIERI